MIDYGVDDEDVVVDDIDSRYDSVIHFSLFKPMRILSSLDEQRRKIPSTLALFIDCASSN